MGPPKLKLLLAVPAWRALRLSLQVPDLAPQIPLSDGPVIFACLHRDILGAILYVRPARPYLLVSASDDGMILVKTLGEKDYGFVRGATGENGGRALVSLRRELEKGHSIGLAVDGPKGPFGEIQAGVFQLAQLTGAPIVPLRALCRPSVTLNTWDRTMVPLPFARLQMEVGKVRSLQPDTDKNELMTLRRQLHGFFETGREVTDENC